MPQIHTDKVERRQIAYTGYALQYDVRRFSGRQNAYLERIRIRGVLHSIGQDRFERRVLDVGCGTGRGPVALAMAGFTHVKAVDFTGRDVAYCARETDGTRRPEVVSLVRGHAKGRS